MILTIDHFLSEEECSNLIKIFESNYHTLGNEYKKSKTLKLYPIISSLDEYNKTVVFAKYIHAKLTCEANKYDSVYISNIELVKWDKGSYMDKHYDHAEDTFGCIINLNENYTGGNTVISNKTIMPKIGKLLIFDSSKQEHFVSVVEDNVRYTCAFWCRKYVNS